MVECATKQSGRSYSAPYKFNLHWSSKLVRLFTGSVKCDQTRMLFA